MSRFRVALAGAAVLTAVVVGTARSADAHRCRQIPALELLHDLGRALAAPLFPLQVGQDHRTLHRHGLVQGAVKDALVLPFTNPL